MKKLLILLMVLVLSLSLSLSGCARLKTTLCNQDADQAAAITQQIAEALDSLAFFQKMFPSAPVLAIIGGLKLTITTLTEMRKGYCATPAQVEAVKATLVAAREIKLEVKSGRKLSLQ